MLISYFCKFIARLQNRFTIFFLQIRYDTSPMFRNRKRTTFRFKVRSLKCFVWPWCRLNRDLKLGSLKQCFFKLKVDHLNWISEIFETDFLLPLSHHHSLLVSFFPLRADFLFNAEFPYNMFPCDPFFHPLVLIYPIFYYFAVYLFISLSIFFCFLSPCLFSLLLSFFLSLFSFTEQWSNSDF